MNFSSINELRPVLQTTELELKDHGVLIVWLSRVERRNAFTERMSDELVEIYRVVSWLLLPFNY
jgi:enoyl-CoA hydratase/carnithine racemase